MLTITSDFDAGNIICLSSASASAIQLEIKKDNKSDFYQWFYYCLSGAKGQSCTMSIENAKGAAFVGGWDGYNTCASYDRETWFRVPSRYDNGELIIEHTPEQDRIYYAYFAPYSMERHGELIAKSSLHKDVSASVIGQTLDGQNMDLLTIGTPAKGKKIMWVIARQHPGESMAEWWMEGFLARLLDDNDEMAKKLRKHCVFYVIPNMNPDGSKRGHLRTNACGANLNREWVSATMERSPEVLFVKQAMEKLGIDFCLDVHGDEALPYNFIAGAEGVPSYTKKGADLLAAFMAAYEECGPDFQTKYGYDIVAPGAANLTVCTNYIAETYGCLAMTLEMPFKDNADAPDETYGWSPKRSAKLGADVLGAMLSVLDDL